MVDAVLQNTDNDVVAVQIHADEVCRIQAKRCSIAHIGLRFDGLFIPQVYRVGLFFYLRQLPNGELSTFFEALILNHGP